MSGYNSISQNKILLQKSNIVKGIVENLENTKFLVAVNYNGHFTNSLNLLRSELKQEQTKLKIFKNTFFKRALLTLNERGNSQWNLDHLLIKDQIAFCLFPEEFSNGLKKVYDFFNQDMLFGWQSGNIVSKEELIKLATLPSKEQLYSQLIFFLSFTLSELVRVLQLVLDKK